MNEEERKGILNYNKNKGITEPKQIKWKTICLETKNHADQPKSLITGEVMYIYPTGDISFKKITSIEIWSPDKNKFTKIQIPKQYTLAKKIVVRREIVAMVLYLKEDKKWNVVVKR